MLHIARLDIVARLPFFQVTFQNVKGEQRIYSLPHKSYIQGLDTTFFGVPFQTI
jgi:hypothetical protein